MSAPGSRPSERRARSSADWTRRASRRSARKAPGRARPTWRSRRDFAPAGASSRARGLHARTRRSLDATWAPPMQGWSGGVLPSTLCGSRTARGRLRRDGRLELEPHERAWFRDDSPAIGELIDEVKAPARIERCAGRASGGHEATAVVADRDPKVILDQGGLETHLTAGAR